MQEYPNHYQMKQNRLVKVQQTKGLCEICSNKANTIHHKDGSKDNHALENLIVLCKHCHSLIHADRKNNTSIFRRAYGLTLQEMSNKFGGSLTFYYNLHKKDTLKNFLESKNKA